MAHPISGQSYVSVMSYYTRVTKLLKKFGYEVLCPMTGKEMLRTDMKLRSHGLDQSPVTTNHAISERDRWMVSSSDIVYLNLLGATMASIGCCMELAWAHDKGKHTIVVLEPGNIHEHAFVLEAADVVFNNEADALLYLKKLSKGI
jgi:nucleoside 2-deoxyribosyltransferase